MLIKGSIKSGIELGYPYKNGTKYVVHSCIGCNKLRWVRLVNNKPRNLRCYKCSAKIESPKKSRGNSPKWKGGKYHDKHGYIHIRLYPDDPLYPMANSHRSVFEHRLVVARALGRCLEPWEIVHHLNGIKDDNRYPENLMLLTNSNHSKMKNEAIYQMGIKEGRRQVLEELNVKTDK